MECMFYWDFVRVCVRESSMASTSVEVLDPCKGLGKGTSIEIWYTCARTKYLLGGSLS